MRIPRGMFASILIILASSLQAETIDDVLSLGEGAIILSYSDEHSSDWNAEWSAIALLDETTKLGWASRRNAPFPHWFVIELPALRRLENIAFDNRGVQERDYPGISARRIVFRASPSGPDRDLVEIADVEVPRSGETRFRIRWRITRPRMAGC